MWLLYFVQFAGPECCGNELYTQQLCFAVSVFAKVEQLPGLETLCVPIALLWRQFMFEVGVELGKAMVAAFCCVDHV